MIFKHIKEIKFLVLIFLFFPGFLRAQVLDGVRFGGGLGYSYYIGTQSDYIPTLSTFGINEFNSGYNLQIYKAIDRTNEFGFRYLKTELWSFKSKNTQAIYSNLSDFGVIYQRSLNDNNGMSSTPFTFNALIGVGAVQYNSFYYIISPNKDFIPNSSVGNGNQPVPAGLIIRPKQIAVTGIIGFNVGLRIAQILSLYFENSFTLSSNNNITGNLNYKSKVPVNGFTYHALSLYFNFGNERGKIGCPKF